MDTLRIGDKVYYSIQKAALMYGVTEKTIYEWIKKEFTDNKKVGNQTFVRKIS